MNVNFVTKKVYPPNPTNKELVAQVGMVAIVGAVSLVVIKKMFDSME